MSKFRDIHDLGRVRERRYATLNRRIYSGLILATVFENFCCVRVSWTALALKTGRRSIYWSGWSGFRAQY
jgi:hypothetical protein